MNRLLGPLVLVPALAMSGACEASPLTRDAAETSQTNRLQRGGNVQSSDMQVARNFTDLDHYLKYLRKQSELDGSWYREIRPGVYELQLGNLRLDNDKRQRIFTREELERKYGFRK